MKELTPLFEDLRNLLGQNRVISDPTELIVYECDGLTLNTFMPDAVVYPESTEEVSNIVKTCIKYKIPFLARGAGTGLSGGAVAADGGVIIQMSRMNNIVEIDYDDEIAVVQPGVVNLHLSQATLSRGFIFAPDPSSQKACTLGGNVAENAGGPHTLKYGVTSNHILGLKVVMPSGEIVDIGGQTFDVAGYDLTGLFVGSEGTFGIITEITVQLIRNPELSKTFLAVFNTIKDASNTVSHIITSGIIPAAHELIDNLIIQAVESHLKVGFPTNAEAILLIEIDGISSTLEDEVKIIEKICHNNHVVNLQLAKSEEEKELLWRGRKEAIGALGKITPAFHTNDGVVPISKLPKILELNSKIGKKYGLRVAHVCHAGDGNIHPIILYNPDIKEEVEAAIKISEEILKQCLEMGGTLTGEHGIGMEKRDSLNLMFSDVDQSQMFRVKNVFNPDCLLNPYKIFPIGGKCGEVKLKKQIQGIGWL